MMKQKYGMLVTAFVALYLLVGMTSCSDDSTSGEDNASNCNSATLPTELIPVAIADEYFDSQNVVNDQEHSVYYEVENVVSTGNGYLSLEGNTSLIASFLALAPSFNIQPEAQDGSCVWDINLAEYYPQSDFDVAITVIASEGSNQVNWDVILDGDFGEESVEDFLFLDGFTSNDEMTGEWNGYDPENPEGPAYIYTWNIESEDNYELTYNDDDGSINYTRNGVAENTIMYNQSGATTHVFWDEDNDTGGIERPEGERRCYEDFINTPCP